MQMQLCPAESKHAQAMPFEHRSVLGKLLMWLLLQDEVGGGISDRPEDMVDVYHTFFGIAGLSLMGRCGLEPIDPVYALPARTVQHLRQSAVDKG